MPMLTKELYERMLPGCQLPYELWERMERASLILSRTAHVPEANRERLRQVLDEIEELLME